MEKKRQSREKDNGWKKSVGFKSGVLASRGTLPGRFKKRRSGGEDRGSMQVRCIPWINFFYSSTLLCLMGSWSGCVSHLKMILCLVQFKLCAA